MTLSRTSIDFVARAGSNPNPAQYKVAVKINGEATSNYSASNSSTWLDLGPSGTDTIYVTALSAPLATGVYHDTISITSSGASNSPLLLPVTLTVTDWLWTEPSELQFSGLVDDNDPPVDSIMLLAFSGTQADYIVENSAPWLVVSPSAGAVPDSIEIAVNLTGLSHGMYSDSVVFTSPDLPGIRAVLYCDLNVSSWTKQPLTGLGPVCNFEGVTFIDASTGWIVGWFPGGAYQPGLVYRTTNGGQVWQEVLRRDGSRLGGVDFIDSQKGWVVGDSATMVRTANGGDSWTVVPNLPVDSTVSFRQVAFADRNTGWAAGTDGYILRTLDSGDSWQITPTPTDFDLTEICALNNQQVWVAGNHGVLLYTDNGGDSWQAQNTGTLKDLRAVSFVDADHGWIAGVNGLVWRTVNGGASWEPLVSGTESGILDIRFVTLERGWLVGLDGIILRTSDGGDTWVQQLSGTDIGLYDLYFVDENIGWVVGYTGTVLKTASGGF
jgi:photosystem II stability/assembly factor-like uncharacterized protein